MASKKLTILFVPLDAWGHINCAHGVAGELKERGHRVVFALDETFKEKLTQFGFEEEIHESPSNGDEEYWPKLLRERSEFLYSEPIVIADKFWLDGAKQMFEDVKFKDAQFKEIIARVKPDIIVTDGFICSPTLHNNKIPWVWLFPAAPHFALAQLNDDRVPPLFSGLPLNGNKEEWIKYKVAWNLLYKELGQNVNKYSVLGGGPKLEDNCLYSISPHLNVLYWPNELMYDELMPLPPKWTRVENILRITNQTFEVPKQLIERPGKLILLSIGTIGCAHLELMIKLTTILAKSEHKFIVSKGPVFANHKLPANMWGQSNLPQTAIYPKVDLVITHGGNNTINEIFYYGKPMLVLPIFADQIDNGQRVYETGLGLRLNPFHCTESELLSAVNRLVSDKALAERMTIIGHRIRNTNDKKRVSELIERLVE